MNFLELNEEELQMVEQMGYTGFAPAEIAEVLEINKNVLESHFLDQESAIYKRYRKGYLQGQMKLRQRIMKDAGNGSSPAQTLMKKIYDECDHQLKNL